MKRLIAYSMLMILLLTGCGGSSQQSSQGISIPDDLEDHEKIELFIEESLKEAYGDCFYVVTQTQFDFDKQHGLTDKDAPTEEHEKKVLFFDATVWDEHTWKMAKESYEKGSDSQARWDKEKRKIDELCQSFQDYANSLSEECYYITTIFRTQEFDGEMVYQYSSYIKGGEGTDYYTEEYAWMHKN